MADLLDSALSIRVVVTLSQRSVDKLILTPHKEGFLLAFDGADSPALKRQVIEWFLSYLQGNALPIEFDLKLESLSPFFQEVLVEMQKIPFGEVCCYSQLAERVGSPRGARAVGNVCRGNPFPLIIPCHRVVAHSGIGGFAYGIEMKKQLLNFEIGFKLFSDKGLLGSIVNFTS